MAAKKDDGEVERRRQYHRDYYARNKDQLRTKALRRSYKRYLAFVKADEGDTNAQTNDQAQQ